MEYEKVLDLTGYVDKIHVAPSVKNKVDPFRFIDRYLRPEIDYISQVG